MEKNEGLVSTAIIALMLGVSHEYVNRLARSGDLPVKVAATGKGGRNKFNLRDVHEWDIARRLGTSQGEETTLPAEQLRKVTAEADRIELENAVTRGELIPVGDVGSFVQDLAVQMRASMRGVAGRVAADVAGEKDVAVVQRMIATEHDRILNGYAGGLEQYAEALEARAARVGDDKNPSGS